MAYDIRITGGFIVDGTGAPGRHGDVGIRDGKVVALGHAPDVAARTIAADGRVVWDLDAYAFLEGDAPDTANPSLWRQGPLLIQDGLFEVVPGIYQLRGFDLSVMTVVEGDTGVIVIDPLISKETAAAAFALYAEHRGDRPVVAMIYTHSHIDHFGGVKGIISDDDVRSGRTQVLAPAGFMEAAVSENVFAGTAMAQAIGGPRQQRPGMAMLGCHRPGVGVVVGDAPQGQPVAAGQVGGFVRGERFGFEIDPFSRHCLLNGLDEIGLTLQHAEAIRAFEARHRQAQPWLFL